MRSNEAPLEARTFRVGGKPYYGQLYQLEDGRFYGMAWDDHDLNILQTQEFLTPEQVWENMQRVLEAMAR